jgi:hypothetical protein
MDLDYNSFEVSKPSQKDVLIRLVASCSDLELPNILPLADGGNQPSKIASENWRADLGL